MLSRDPDFLNLGVNTGVEWPTAETEYDFGRWKIVAMPPTTEHEASLHIDLGRHRLTRAEGASVLNQVMSIAVWLDDQFGAILTGMAGSTKPSAVPRTTQSFPSSIVPHWTNAWNPIADQRQRLALAIYREAVNMQHFHSMPFAVVGFYRIAELVWAKGLERGDALEIHIADIIAGDTIWLQQLKWGGYIGDTSPKALAVHIREECRNAAAHAAGDPIINPDDAAHQHGMAAVATLMRRVARTVIQKELKVGRDRWKTGP